jgi:hypothetical protein
MRRETSVGRQYRRDDAGRRYLVAPILSIDFSTPDREIYGISGGGVESMEESQRIEARISQVDGADEGRTAPSTGARKSLHGNSPAQTPQRAQPNEGLSHGFSHGCCSSRRRNDLDAFSVSGFLGVVIDDGRRDGVLAHDCAVAVRTQPAADPQRFGSTLVMSQSSQLDEAAE